MNKYYYYYYYYYYKSLLSHVLPAPFCAGPFSLDLKFCEKGPRKLLGPRDITYQKLLGPRD